MPGQVSGLMLGRKRKSAQKRSQTRRYSASGNTVTECSLIP
ncbi:hypothetical protein SGLAM104S_08701 [Streptomyces glaucescens]